MLYIRIACASDSSVGLSANAKTLREEEHYMTTVALINGMVSAGISIALLVGVLAMGMGMAAGK